MANTKVTKAVLADDAVGLDQLDITNDPSDGQALTAVAISDGYNLTWATVGVSGIDSSADATAITINSSEQVGIGVSPDTLLHVSTTGSGDKAKIGNGTRHGFIAVDSSGVSLGNEASQGGELFYLNEANGYASIFTGGSERIRITSGGQLLVGKTSGTGGNAIEVNNRISAAAGSTSQPTFNCEGDTNTGINLPESDRIQFITGGTERMRIDSVGFASFKPSTSSDNYGLEVITANSSDTGIKVGRAGASNGIFGLAVVSNGASSIGKLQFDGDGTIAFSDSACIELRDGLLVRIQQAFSNPTYATNRAVYAEDQGELGYNASVRASKTNITDVDDVDWLYNLNAKTFNKRKKIQGAKQDDGTFAYTYSDTEHSGITEYGFIAEDLEALAPELCFYEYIRDTDSEGNELDTSTKGDLQGIHYEAMVAPMLKLIQDQKSLIDNLTTRIETLENN